MVILYRYVTPAAGFEIQIAEHLTLRERNVPCVIPRGTEVSRFLAKLHITLAFLSFCYEREEIQGVACIERRFLVFAVGVEC